MTKPNWDNQTIWTSDNLDVMRGMNSESVDLIYLDPPFNSNTDYAAPVGSEAAGAAFKDTWGLNDIDMADHRMIKHKRPGMFNFIQAAREIHGDSMMSYLLYMGTRIIEMHRILKPTGSLYLHCDATASHYLKVELDSIFGKNNFKNEIVWSYRRWPSKQKNFQRMNDFILRYSKTKEVIWNQLFEPLSKSSQKMWKGKRRIDVNTSAGTREKQSFR